jgi:hypothetical protein
MPFSEPRAGGLTVFLTNRLADLVNSAVNSSTKPFACRVDVPQVSIDGPCVSKGGLAVEIAHEVNTVLPVAGDQNALQLAPGIEPAFWWQKERGR